MAKKTKNINMQTVAAPPKQVEATTTPAPVAITGDAPAAGQAAASEGTDANQRGSNVIPGKSTVDKPTKLVWTIADEMIGANPQATRKQIVDECVRRGVAYYTARTQYQRWSKSRAPSR